MYVSKYECSYIELSKYIHTKLKEVELYFRNLTLTRNSILTVGMYMKKRFIEEIEGTFDFVCGDGKVN
jgi:hypothetical protein